MRYVFFAIIFFFCTTHAVTADSDVEHARYSVVAASDDIEIRDYPAQIIAETIVSGERAAAISEGFRRLAGYIFGANQPNEKIAMTAPVGQSPDGANWRVTFTMPMKYSLSELPKPNNETVHLVQLAPKRMAVIRFSGLVDDHDLATQQAKLTTYLQQHNLTSVSSPAYAFYDPPWTLPFNRRNEVLIEIAGK